MDFVKKDVSKNNFYYINTDFHCHSDEHMLVVPLKFLTLTKCCHKFKVKL